MNFAASILQRQFQASNSKRMICQQMQISRHQRRLLLLSWPISSSPMSSSWTRSMSRSSNSSSGQDTSHDNNRNDKDDESPLIVSQFNNRIVHKLWTERAKAKKSPNKNAPPLGGTKNCPSTLLVAGKTPCQSETTVDFPFSSQELLAESYRSPWNTMRIGRLLEDLDALAGNIAFYHVRKQDNTPSSNRGNDEDEAQQQQQQQEEEVHPLIVTASIDRIKLRKDSPSIDLDQTLSGRVTYVGSSSMEIKMHCRVVGDKEPWLEAYFTFVTLDPETKKPMNITPLLPQNAQEQVDFDLGAKKAALKKQRRKEHKQTAAEVQEHAERLLQEAQPVLLHFHCSLAAKSLLMSATKMQNAMIAQPQVRNLHNRIFGGFLVRKAFELAFANAYVFGGSHPIFKEVDEVSFAAPVDVGDLLVFNSRILYTSSNQTERLAETDLKPLVRVEVECWVTEPETASAKLSNQFYFTFAIARDEVNENTVPSELRQIIPANIDEATRMALRMKADRDQDAY